MRLDVLTVLAWVLLLAWIATIAGAAFDAQTKRSKVREVVSALAMPLTMFMSKRRNCQGKLSTLRVLALALFAVVVGMVDAPLDKIELWALVSPAALLLLDTLLAHVPLTEFLAALTAVFGGMVTKRVKTEKVVEQTTVTEAVPRAPEPEPAADGAVG